MVYRLGMPGSQPISPLSGVPTADVLGPLNDVETKNAPPRLFLAGDASLLQQGVRVAVVGTREPSEDGTRRARRLTRALVEAGVTVVSGLALGVDSIAHRTAIAAGGRTIAVLGTPLEDIHPPSNAELQREIAAGHLLVSMFAPGHPVSRSNFPRRNRLMALLTDATVIVEAGDSSGTLSQGWEALRLGRSLYILKSVAERSDLSWPREMVQYGAQILADPATLIAELPPVMQPVELAF